MTFYILDNKIPKTVSNRHEWEKWMHQFEDCCIICNTRLNGNIFISTTFFGCSSVAEPLLFETVIIGGLYNGFSAKTSTWQEAEEAHQRAVKIVMAQLN
jgi:hypothetical protein